MDTGRKTGIVLMVLAVVLFIFGFSYVRLAESALLEGHKIGPQGECIHDEGSVCPYARLSELAFPKYAALIADLALFVIGAVLALRKGRLVEPSKKRSVSLGGLSVEERRAFSIIRSAEGGIFQSQLGERLGTSKVRLTRLLDRLEAKQIIERKRRGMTNIVLARRN